MKKLIALFLALTMVFALCACGQSAAPAAQTEASPAAAEPAEPVDKTPGWPEKQMTIIIAAAAGGANDLCARVVTNKLQEKLGCTIVYEYVSGGGQWNGWKQLIESEPDGNTFGYIAWPSSDLAQYNELNPMPYGRDNFLNLACQVFEPSSISIRTNDDRFSDIDSFIEYAKDNEVVATCSSNSIANGDFTFMNWLNVTYGTKITVMPIDSSTEGYARFIAGDTDVYIGSIGDVAADINEGLFKVLGITAEERMEDYPDIPTFIEQGYDMYIGSFRGFAFPIGVDQAIVDEMQQALIECITETEDELRQLGHNPCLLYGDELEETITRMMQDRLDAFGLGWDDKFA